MESLTMEEANTQLFTQEVKLLSAAILLAVVSDN